MSHFSKLFVGGVPVLGGSSLPTTTGNVFFVDAGHASASDQANSEWGKDKDRPFSTIDYAIGRCTASNGDIIVAMPGHTETVTAAAGIDFDVAGISLIGLGKGADRPTITFSTAVGADMDIDAASTYIENILFVGGIDALTGIIDVNAADCTLRNIETRDSTGQMTDCIVCDANADRLLIDGWVHRGAAGDGGDSALLLVGGDDIEVRNFDIYGNFDTGAIESETTANVRIRIHHGRIWTEGAEDLAINLLTASTGLIGPEIDIFLQDNAANITEAVVCDGAAFFQPIRLVNLAGESSMQTNITASTDA